MHGGIELDSCLACAVQQSVSQRNDIQAEEEAIDRILHNKSLTRRSVPRDGWCLVTSWFRALQNQGIQYPGGPQGLAKAGCQELLRNPSEYMLYRSTGSMRDDVRWFLEETAFNSQTINHLGYALAKVTDTKCIIVTEQFKFSYREENVVYANEITLCLMNLARHYDYAVPTGKIF